MTEAIEGAEIQDQQEATAAEPQNTETPQAASGPGPIPYERFKDVNEKFNAAQKQLAKLQEAEKKRERETLSEVERLQAEKGDLESQLNEARSAVTRMLMKDAFRAEIARKKLRFVDGAETDAFALANLEGVEADEDGAITGMEAVVKALVKEKPYLFAQPEAHNTDGAAGRGTGKQPVDENKEAELKGRFGIR